MRAAAARLTALAVLLTLSACSSYERRWQAARNWSPGPAVASVKRSHGSAVSVRAPHDLYQGAWIGTWSSTKYPGEGGELKGILTRLNEDAGHGYSALFHARWRKLFASTHEVNLFLKPAVRHPGEARAFTGTSELHTLLGSGTYRCAGTLTPTHFHATYDATYDTGVLDMDKVATSRPVGDSLCGGTYGPGEAPGARGAKPTPSNSAKTGNAQPRHRLDN